MSFPIIISILIAEILALLLGSTLSFLLLREHRARRQRHLLYFGLGLLFFSLAFGSLFLGQMLFFYGPSAPVWPYVLFKYLLLGHLLTVVFGLVDCYAGGRQTLWRTMAVFAVLLLAWSSSGLGCNTVLTDGVVLCDASMVVRSLFLLAFFAVLLLMIVLTGRIRFMNCRQPEICRPDTLLMRGGVCGLVLIYVVAIAAIAQNGWIMLLAFLPTYAYLILLFFGAGAKKNPAQDIVARPLNLICRSLVIKTSFYITALFWSLGLVITVVTATLYVRTLVSVNESNITQDGQALADDFMHEQEILLRDTSLAAAQNISVADLAADGGSVVAELARAYGLREGRLIVRITDDQENILFSDNGSDEIGQRLESDSDIVKRANAGYKTAVFEKDGWRNRVVLRAAAPLLFDDGSRGTIVAVSEYIPDFSLDRTKTKPSAYGLLTESGETVFTAGQVLDRSMLSAVEKAGRGARFVTVRLADGSILGASRILDSNGLPQGYIYVLLTMADMGAAFMRTLSLILLMNLLALIVLTLVLFTVLGALLKPIQELRAAAAAVEREDYSRRIIYDSSDEIGETAAVFNKMSSTIADRTAKLREALRQQMDALTHTAHEMLTPLNVLRWTIDLMRFGDTGRLNRQQLELVEQMHQTNRRLVGLVQNLLEVSKLEQGRLVLKKSVFAVEDAIDEAAGIISIKAREKNIELAWRRPRKALPKVRGDQDRVVQILLNLLSNAVKYTDIGGRVSVSVGEAGQAAPDGPQGRFIEVAVRDNGRGITEADQKRLFERFFRAASVIKDDIEGTGLGLHIVRGLVEMHGGRIWVESESGSGSTFRFTLPTVK